MTNTTRLRDLDGTSDAADWLEAGHMLDDYEVQFLRNLIVPEATPSEAPGEAFDVAEQRLVQAQVAYASSALDVLAARVRDADLGVDSLMFSLGRDVDGWWLPRMEVRLAGEEEPLLYEGGCMDGPGEEVSEAVFEVLSDRAFEVLFARVVAPDHEHHAMVHITKS